MELSKQAIGGGDSRVSQIAPQHPSMDVVSILQTGPKQTSKIDQAARKTLSPPIVSNFSTLSASLPHYLQESLFVSNFFVHHWQIAPPTASMNKKGIQIQEKTEIYDLVPCFCSTINGFCEFLIHRENYPREALFQYQFSGQLCGSAANSSRAAL